MPAVAREVVPASEKAAGLAADWLEHARVWLREHRPYAYCVLLPTLITAAYYFLIAAPQDLSEAHFVVLSPPVAGTTVPGAMLTPVGDTNTLAVLDFMQSREAVASLHQQVNVESVYRRPRIDFIARIRSEPTLEQMYKYLFRRGAMIKVNYDFMNFVGVIKVFAFDPADAQRVADTLLKLGDQLVDRLNKRSAEDALRVARAEVKRAEDRVAAIDEKITGFRTKQRELDYSKSAETIQDVIGKLESSLAQARSDLTAAKSYMKPDSPSYQQLQNQVRALEQQIDTQKGRLTGPDGAIAPDMAAYERLQLERTFAQSDYESASRALENAFLQAQRQQLFLVRTVDATPAQESDTREAC